MNVTRVPMPSRDKYPCKECQKRYPACQDKCPDKLAADKVNNERKAIERQKRYAENAIDEYKIARNMAAARRKLKER